MNALKNKYNLIMWMSANDVDVPVVAKFVEMVEGKYAPVINSLMMVVIIMYL